MGSRLRAFIGTQAGKISPALVEAYGRNSRRTAVIADAVCANEPEVVHCHDVHTLPVGAIAKRRLGCRIVYDAHEIYEELAQGNKGAARRYKWLHNRYVDIVDRFITINESIADWYAEHYPSLPKAMIVMNAAAQMPNSFAYDGRLHEAAGLAPDARILLYQGGFATKRGLENLVLSAAYLPRDWNLVMMGWGRSEEQLRNLARSIIAKADREPPVRFVPPAAQSELPLWTAGATIGIIPYENVGLNHLYCTPNKLWEYPNAGVPVLVSPLPELRKPVEAYGCGWVLTDPQEPQTVAEQIASLTDTEINAARNACHAFIENENWSKYGERLIELYEKLMSPSESRVPESPARHTETRTVDA
jgi:glycosyltransferase involved in cell wall biosynthesis